MNERLNVTEAARFVGVSVPTLNRWHYDDKKKEGISKPRRMKIGGKVFYWKNDLLIFLGFEARNAVKGARNAP